MKVLLPNRNLQICNCLICFTQFHNLILSDLIVFIKSLVTDGNYMIVRWKCLHGFSIGD